MVLSCCIGGLRRAKMSVKCELCGESFSTVTNSHLRHRHGITVATYVEMFPCADLVSEDTKSLLAEAGLGNTNALGHRHSDETCRLISEAGEGWVHRPETLRKMSVAARGNTYAAGRVNSPETLRKMSEAQVGRVHSDETKRLLSKLHLGKTHSEESLRLMSESHKKMWQDPEFIHNWSESMKLSSHRKPNNSELQLQSILDKHFPGEWEYIGDGKDVVDWVGRRNPDFINVNNRKRVLEMFGVYYHDPDLFPNRMSEGELIAHYEKYGVDCLVVWEYDIFDDAKVVELVKEFMSRRRISCES